MAHRAGKPSLAGGSRRKRRRPSCRKIWRCSGIAGRCTAWSPAPSDGRRSGIFLSLVVNWLAAEENQYLAFPPEDAAHPSLCARQLLGYRASPTCGWVKGRNSAYLLSQGTSGPL